MALLTQTPYKARAFDLSGLTGISDNTLEVHFGLYGGYVKNTNLLNEQLVTMMQGGQSSSPAYAELTRRLGFEYNGMVLHEWYFGNLTKASGGGISSSSALGRALGESFGDIETWRKDFSAIGAMRGVDASGWDFLASTDQLGTLQHDIGLIRSCPLMPPDLQVGGFIFDVHSGELAPADQP